MSIQAPGVGTTGRPGLIDTSVALDLPTIDLKQLPGVIAISSLTMAELVSGPGAAENDLERWRRMYYLRYAWSHIDPLDFDLACARAYGAIYEATVRIGRKPRGGRAVDLMIAATALAHDLPLYTKNPKDLRGLEELIEIVDAAA
jgi:predicted nucleic acid-binding protein